MKSDGQWVDVHQQRGMTVIGGLLLLIIVCFMVLIAIRIIPIYIDYFTVRTTLDGLKKEPQINQMTAVDIHNTLEKRFGIGYVNVVQARQVKLRRQGNIWIAELVYEDRRTVIANVDVIATFNITMPLTPP
jgi:hypothetical protein